MEHKEGKSKRGRKAEKKRDSQHCLTPKLKGMPKSTAINESAIEIHQRGYGGRKFVGREHRQTIKKKASLV